MTILVDPLALSRVSARAADKYVTRDGAEPSACPSEVRRAQGDERQMLEMAFEHVRRGLSSTSTTGKGARQQLRLIEEIMIRDYGLYSRIKPDRDPT